MQRVRIKRSKDGQFYYTVQAGNNEVIHTSETYHGKGSAEASIEALWPEADVVDETITPS